MPAVDGNGRRAVRRRELQTYAANGLLLLGEGGPSEADLLRVRRIRRRRSSAVTVSSSSSASGSVSTASCWAGS